MTVCKSHTLRRGESSILTHMIIFEEIINVTLYIEPRNEVKIFYQKLTLAPLRREKNIFKYRVYKVYLALQYGFNTAIGKLIRVHWAEISSEKCQILMVWFG
jgi:hypothetical protein